MSGKDSFEIDFFEKIHRRLPNYADVVEILGGLYTREGRIDEGLKMDRKLVRMMPENPKAHYNLACSLALKRRGTEAIRSLSKAVDLGYRDLEWLLQDPDLDSIKGFPRFRKLISALKESN